LLQRQTGLSGFLVSLAFVPPLPGIVTPTFCPPIVIGSTQDQQISVIGFMN